MTKFAAVTRDEMQELDRRAIRKYKIDEPLLMEVAGFQIFQEIKNLSNSFLIFCSSGNNGGDGLVLARHLYITGTDVTVVLAGKPEKMKPSSLANYNSLKALGVPIIEPSDSEWEDPLTFEKIKNLVKKAGCSVDSLFGTGLSRDITGKYRDLIEIINKYSALTMAVDIPSGIDATTGSVKGIAVKANITITMHRNKTGFKNASEYTGKVIPKYIGIPDF